MFTKTKDKIDKLQQHNVVYEIGCKGKENESCDKVYIGTTKRALGTRSKEHQADITKKRLTTALAQHIHDKEHTADFDNIRILDKEKRTNTRYTLESLRIQQKMTTTMNTKEDKDNINTSYMYAI